LTFGVIFLDIAFPIGHKTLVTRCIALSPPLLAATIAVAALLGVRADACEPRPEPSPTVPLLSIDLTAETMTTDRPGVTISPIDYGSNISLEIANAAAPRVFRISIPLPSDERITVLQAGGAAITQTLSLPAGGDYKDYPDQVHDDSSIATLPEDEVDDGIQEDQDQSGYPSGDEVDANTRDGEVITSDAFELANRQIPDGDWVIIAAFDPPSAVDANGKTVPVSLAKSSSGLTVTVSPPHSAAFPVDVALRYGYDPDSYDPPSSDTAAAGVSAKNKSLLQASSSTVRSTALGSAGYSARASSTCSGERSEIVISASSGSTALDDAFRKYPTRCAVYYVSIAPTMDTNEPREDRWAGQGNAAQRLKALNKKATTKKEKSDYPHWNTSGASFVPVAEISFGRINARDFSNIGRAFTRTMKRVGYGIWSIDEFPCSIVNDLSSRDWNNFTLLVRGLSQSGRVQGVVFNCYQRQDSGQSKVRAIKKNTKSVYTKHTSADWKTLSVTKLWAEEAYTFCSRVCVSGTSLGAKATHANAYMQHSARLAFAPGAPLEAGAIQDLFRTRFLPLINGWGGKPAKDDAYGNNDLTVRQIRKLASLQTYAARAWAKQGDHPYSALRIGVRWTDYTNGSDWKKPNRDYLARRIARAIAGAYRPGGKPLGACDPSGGGNTGLCQATVSGAKFTDAWATFRLWNNTICPRPSNDDFADARSLSGTEDLIDGTLNCATWESSETAPGGGSKSVWYKWKAPYDDYALDFSAYDPDGSLQTNVYPGDSLGGLSREYGNFSGGCGVLSTTAGTNYMIQVVNTRFDDTPAPTGAFTLHWGSGGGCVE
jgi:hypothetical protein